MDGCWAPLRRPRCRYSVKEDSALRSAADVLGNPGVTLGQVWRALLGVDSPRYTLTYQLLLRVL